MPTTANNGQMIVKPTEVTPVIPMALPQISGSIAQAAAAKTAAETFKKTSGKKINKKTADHCWPAAE